MPSITSPTISEIYAQCKRIVELKQHIENKQHYSTDEKMTVNEFSQFIFRSYGSSQIPEYNAALNHGVLTYRDARRLLEDLQSLEGIGKQFCRLQNLENRIQSENHVESEEILASVEAELEQRPKTYASGLGWAYSDSQAPSPDVWKFSPVVQKAYDDLSRKLIQVRAVLNQNWLNQVSDASSLEMATHLASTHAEPASESPPALPEAERSNNVLASSEQQTQILNPLPAISEPVSALPETVSAEAPNRPAENGSHLEPQSQQGTEFHSESPQSSEQNFKKKKKFCLLF